MSKSSGPQRPEHWRVPKAMQARIDEEMEARRRGKVPAKLAIVKDAAPKPAAGKES